jgi:biotin carboxylase
MRRNVFVIGLDASNRELLERLPVADECRFHTLLDFSQLRGVDDFPIANLLGEGERRLDEFGESIDGICTCIDFPATEFAPLIGAKRGLPGPSLEGILACNHKYWSRVLQREGAPEAVPGFVAFDPYRDDPLHDIHLNYPFWIKPLNAFRSHLGFRINHPQDFHAALPAIREELPRLAQPLGTIMKYAHLPGEIAHAGAQIMLAEQILSGRLCTAEGYVYQGEPHVYGIVDSIRVPNRSSFARYQYPSALPAGVQRRMKDVAYRVMRSVGLQDNPFNMELFYDTPRDTIRVLEINPRVSQSHAPLFELVDGTSHLQVMVDLALGRRPSEPFGPSTSSDADRRMRAGRYGAAAKFFLRAYRDAVVEAVPTQEDIARLEAEAPGAVVHVLVEPGTRLSELADQDAYSYELAEVYLGARNARELQARWAFARESLPFGLSDPEEERWL